MWYFYGQRRREEFKKALEGALKFFPGIKMKLSKNCVFKTSYLKEKVFSEYEKASYTSFCRNYVRVLVSQDRDKEDDISASDI